MTLRVVAWNCCDQFHKKAGKLLELNPTLTIVPEVREEHAHSLGETYTAHWDGEAGNRGLLVAASEPWRLEAGRRASRRHMMLAKATLGEETVSLVGVWAMLGTGKYVGAVMAGLDEILDELEETNVIVAGDFNASLAFDSFHSRNYQFDQITRRLHAKGLRSLWHTSRAEQFGQETTATFYQQWKREKPFHIDFMFASEGLVGRLKHFSIGDFDTWCSGHSDHVPLIADFD